MQKQLARRGTSRTALNMVCSVSAHGIAALSAFLLTPFLIDRVGIAAYGFYPIAAELTALFGMLTGPLNSTANHRITIADANGDQDTANGYFSTVFFGNAAVSLLLLLPMAIFLFLFPRFLSVPLKDVGELRLFFALVLSTVPVYALCSVFSAAYWLSDRLDVRALEELINVLTKAAVLYICLKLSDSMVGVGLALLLCALSTATFRVPVFRRLAPKLALSPRAFSPALLKRLLPSGFWYTLDRLSGFLMSGGLLLLSNFLLSHSAVGLLSLALTVSRTLNGFLGVAAGVFFPSVAKRLADGETERLHRDILRNQKIGGLLCATAVSVAIGFCRPFFSLWIPRESRPLLWALTAILLLPSLAVASALPLVDLTVAMNRMKKRSLLFFGGALLTPVFAILLCQFAHMDALGVAIASALAQSAWYAVLLPVLSARLLRVSALTLYAPFFRSLMGCALSLSAILPVTLKFPPTSWAHLLFLAVPCGLLALSLCFLCMFGFRKKSKYS